MSWRDHPLLTRGGNMRASEYRTVAETLAARAPCRLLVFGAGLDSELWVATNDGGETTVLEDDPEWAARAAGRVVNVQYGTRLEEWEALLVASPSGSLEMPPPDDVGRTAWDVIFVDGPRGYRPEHPGRMKSIYMAARLARQGRCADVFVHDCDRPVEYVYSEVFLLRENRVKADGKLWHFRLGRDGSGLTEEMERALTAERLAQWRELHRQCLKQLAADQLETIRALRRHAQAQAETIAALKAENARLGG